MYMDYMIYNGRWDIISGKIMAFAMTKVYTRDKWSIVTCACATQLLQLFVFKSKKHIVTTIVLPNRVWRSQAQDREVGCEDQTENLESSPINRYIAKTSFN